MVALRGGASTDDAQSKGPKCMQEYDFGQLMAPATIYLFAGIHRQFLVNRLVLPTNALEPLRYMHTPSEVIDLDDLEAVVQLLVAFARSLTKTTKFI